MDISKDDFFDFDKDRRLRVTDNVKPLALSFLALLKHRGDHQDNYLSITPFQLVDWLSRVLQYENGMLVQKRTLNNWLFSHSKSQTTTYPKDQFFTNFSTIERKRFYQFDPQLINQTLPSIIHIEDKLYFLFLIQINFIQQCCSINRKEGFPNQLNTIFQQQYRNFKALQKDQFLPITPTNRIKINGRVNVLMTFFYELLVEFPEQHGINCLYNTKVEIIRFVTSYFERQDGISFSESFLRNTLTPSKINKRCSPEKRVRIKSFWGI